MTKNFDESQYKRWLDQANQTLSSSENDLKVEDFNWACFKAQQAAEYAIKALLRGLGKLAVGHSTYNLILELEQLGSPISEEIKKCARSLEIHYIPARYPDAYSEGSPYEFYDKDTADEAIKCAKKIINLIKKEKAKYVQSPQGKGKETK